MRVHHGRYTELYRGAVFLCLPFILVRTKADPSHAGGKHMILQTYNPGSCTSVYFEHSAVILPRLTLLTI